MVDMLDYFATVMTAAGDVLILISFFCAMLVFVINLNNARSTGMRRVPGKFLFLGWIAFALSYAGLVSVSRTDTFGMDIGLILKMPLVLAVLVLYFSFAILLLGTAWTLRSRRMNRKAEKETAKETLGQTSPLEA